MPGGSSGGSAAAVAARECVAALGSDTGASPGTGGRHGWAVACTTAYGTESLGRAFAPCETAPAVGIPREYLEAATNH